MKTYRVWIYDDEARDEYAVMVNARDEAEAESLVVRDKPDKDYITRFEIVS